MKTAVSLPDQLFREAEAAAQRLQVSRSELYAKAISAFLTVQSEEAITERLNDIYSRIPSDLDPVLHRLQLKTLYKDTW